MSKKREFCAVDGKIVSSPVFRNYGEIRVCNMHYWQLKRADKAAQQFADHPEDGGEDVAPENRGDGVASEDGGEDGVPKDGGDDYAASKQESTEVHLVC
uniref:Uncharacterized protein n=1 Tax=Panagrolaimus davidi TaxID=227884 RepID=A0A914Q6X2_9BILA